MKKKLVVFTGPSAVGKATIEHELFCDEKLKLRLSVSATTRKPRKGEIDGIHYNFISHKEFDEKIDNNEFIEWNEHFSNKYGTLKSEVERISNDGDVPFIEVDVIGAKNIIEDFGNDNLVSIFIAPPSIEELRERMVARGTENSEQIEERLSRVEKELKYKNLFQHVIINDKLKKAIKKVKRIIKRQR